MKTKPRGEAGTWVYKDGERLTNVGGTIRDADGRVVSGYDGKNLDPEAVKRHKQVQYARLLVCENHLFKTKSMCF